MKSSYFLQQARYGSLNILLFKFSRAGSSVMRVLDILHGINYGATYRLFDDKGEFIKYLTLEDLCKYNYFLYKTFILKRVEDYTVCFSIKEGRNYR